ncbi:MAG: hypothetical protein QM765_43345 [Myxococcales bacterium]
MPLRRCIRSSARRAASTSTDTRRSRKLTGHPFGTGDDACQQWFAWYEQNRGRTQAEWLADRFRGLATLPTGPIDGAGVRVLLSVLGQPEFESNGSRGREPPLEPVYAKRVLQSLDKAMVGQEASEAAASGTAQLKRGAARIARDLPDGRAELVRLARDDDRSVRLVASEQLLEIARRERAQPEAPLTRVAGEFDYDPRRSGDVLFFPVHGQSVAFSLSETRSLGVQAPPPAEPVPDLPLPTERRPDGFARQGDLFAVLTCPISGNTYPGPGKAVLEVWSLATKEKLYAKVLHEGLISGCRLYSSAGVFVVTTGSLTAVLEAQDGALRWELPVSAWSSAIGEGLLAVSRYGQIDLLDLADGALVANYAPKQPAHGGVIEHLEVFNGRLFAFRESEVLVFALPKR